MNATPGDDSVSRFYDEHPYPPPIDDLDAYRRAWSDGSRRRIEHFRLWPTSPFRDDHSILVAGCGTPQAAKYAARYPRARVVGIDVSAASIRATLELAARHELTNLAVHQLPIEDVASLGASFDHIVCTGVLHHLDDPAVGLAALRSVLAPSGVIDLMLYARYGRTGVAMIQEYCRMLDVQPEVGAIDDLVAVLRELPVGHPIGHLLRNTPDFADDDALADALLNPRERTYSVPEVFDLLDASGLQFRRWVRQAPYRPHCGVVSELPHGRQLASLPPQEQFAALELFRGTMVRHSLIAVRDDDPRFEQGFEDSDWQGFVPHRVTTAAIIDDKLPVGVGAALLNRAHTYPDLVLFASAAERATFESIDGDRTIGQIGGDVSFFERLWWHDLIVIDACSAN
ncbi:class I SAM-dependent methyltransferase [Ilumatobacter sp.]|uniref:class I SAM-dependent methyltransferase n=1 Tax=Ilumatobacter sp. TaxID=1967498 RepID=UPI00374FFECA|nr:class I SAM-dependent methyltransferase [Ilumatobacter sp.]